MFYYYYYYFNVVLTWKIVGASKASVIYIYIDKFYLNKPLKGQQSSRVEAKKFKVRV